MEAYVTTEILVLSISKVIVLERTCICTYITQAACDFSLPDWTGMTLHLLPILTILQYHSWQCSRTFCYETFKPQNSNNSKTIKDEVLIALQGKLTQVVIEGKKRNRGVFV